MLLPSSRRSSLLVYLLALALLWSNAYLLLVNHPAAYTVDEQSYLRMAAGDYAVPVTHRYRVAVPWVAGRLAQVLQGLGALVSGPGKPPLGFSFFLVNSLLLALAGLYLFRTARAYGAAAGPALLGMAAIMTCGATTYITSLALVDSTAVLSVVLLYYALSVRSGPLLLAVVVLGPGLKESFLLFGPVVLLYGGFVPLGRRLLALLAAGGLLLALHGLVDALVPPPAVGSVTNALQHGHNILRNLPRLFSLHGLVVYGSVYGLFNLVLLAGAWGGWPAVRQWLPRRFAGPALLGLGVTLAHLLLSGELSRMQLLAAPVVSTAVALIVDRHPLFAPLRQLLASSAAGVENEG